MAARRAAGLKIPRGRGAHPRGRAPREIHPLKPRETVAPKIQRRHRIDSHAPFAVRQALADRERTRIHLDEIAQEVPITEAREALFFLGFGKTRQIVHVRLLEARQVLTRTCRQRCLLQYLAYRYRAPARD